MLTALMIQLTLWQVVVDLAWTALAKKICAPVGAPAADADHVLDVAHSAEAEAAAKRTEKVPARCKSKAFASADLCEC